MVHSQRRGVKTKKPGTRVAATGQTYRCSAEAPQGLEDIARAEIGRLGGQHLRWLNDAADASNELIFEWQGNLRPLGRLQTVHAVYLVKNYPVPRPKALMGHEHFHELLGQIGTVRALFPQQEFKTMYLSAAGSESSVMERLKSQLAAQTGLQIASHEGDLLLRIRRAAKREGWEVLVRLTPRPLSARAWRACNFEGALNAAVANAMCRMTLPKKKDVFINLACGSGSLLVERSSCGPYAQMFGIDLDSTALECASQNLTAAQISPGNLLQADIACAPLPSRFATALAVDLPFGHLVGSHQSNLELYPRVLAEAARLARRGARFALITHEVHLTESLLESDPNWKALQVRRISLGGLYPRIFLLERI